MKKPFKTIDFNASMTITDVDGNVLGQVVEVWAQTSGHGCLPLSRYLLNDFGPVKGTNELLSTPHGYLQVRQRTGLGLSSRDVYIPISAVLAMNSATHATLRWDASTCEVRASSPMSLPLANIA